MEKIEYRAYIKTRSLLGIPATDITNELLQVYGVNAPQYRTVAKWAALFKAGRETLEDDHRSGRPITVHTASNIELVKSIIQHDPHATFDEIVAESSINRYTVGEIINSSLKYKKLASTRID